VTGGHACVSRPPLKLAPVEGPWPSPRSCANWEVDLGSHEASWMDDLCASLVLGSCCVSVDTAFVTLFPTTVEIASCKGNKLLYTGWFPGQSSGAL